MVVCFMDLSSLSLIQRSGYLHFRTTSRLWGYLSGESGSRESIYSQLTALATSSPLSPKHWDIRE